MTGRRKGIPISALVASVVLVLFITVALLADVTAPYGMADIVGGAWQESSSQFPLGTDNLGRDLLSRLLFAARTTILIAAFATLLSFVLGSILGFTAAVVGGWLDLVMSRAVDLMMSIPTLICALVILTIVPPGMQNRPYSSGVRTSRIRNAFCSFCNRASSSAEISGILRSW